MNYWLLILLVAFLGCRRSSDQERIKELENKVATLEHQVKDMGGENYYATKVEESEGEVANTTIGNLDDYFAYANRKKTLISAHRGGGKYAGYPENCLETMKYVANKIPDVIFEIDVAQSKDGFLVLMHDDTLERTTTGNDVISKYTFRELQSLYLVDDFGERTPYKIPLFEAVVAWAVKNNTILMVDIKKSVNYEDIVKVIDQENGWNHCVLITYSIGQAKKLHGMKPIAQLSISIRNEKELNWFEESGIPASKLVAFTGTRNSSDALYNAIHELNRMTILGTLGNIDKQAQAKGNKIYQDYVRRGIDIFATDRPLEVAEAIN